MLKSNLAENIKKYRKKEGLTQVELAEKLDISKHSIISYEKGSTFPASDILEKMLELFKITPNQLFYPLSNNGKELTDKEAKIRELEAYRNNILDTIRNVEENASDIEYEEPVYDEDGAIVTYRDVLVSSYDQARGIVVSAIDLKNLNMNFLVKIFNMKIDEEIKDINNSEVNTDGE